MTLKVTALIIGPDLKQPPIQCNPNNHLYSVILVSSRKEQTTSIYSKKESQQHCSERLLTQKPSHGLFRQPYRNSSGRKHTSAPGQRTRAAADGWSEYKTAS